MFASPMSWFWRRSAPVPLLVLATLLLALGAPALARDRTPAPAGGGPGVHLYPADQLNPLDLSAPGQPRIPRDYSRVPEKSGGRSDDVGGDDVPIVSFEHSYEDDLAVASNGDLFSVVMYAVEEDGDYCFLINRSDDGGTTWREWARFDHPTPGYRYWDPEIQVAEGAEDRVFLIYTLDPGTDPYEVHVAWSPLALTDGDFSNDTTVFTAPTGWIFEPGFTTDAATWNDYFCYLTFSADNGDGNDIYFTRSTDQGTTWEAPYVLGTISVDDRGYYTPKVAVGYGGWVHVAWFLGFDLDHEYDNTIRYRRAPNYAAGGLANWENMQSITSHTDDVDMISTRIAASLVSSDVMMAFIRRERYEDGSSAYDGVMTLSSDDAGASWSGPVVNGSGFDWLGDLVCQDVNDRWLLGVNIHGGWEYRYAPFASPADWSAEIDFADHYYQTGEPSLALDPSQEDRICVVGGGRNTDETFTYCFDAEWRADPGYPNLEPGFPVEFTSDPRSDPAVVDLNGDGYLEIVFSDYAGRIQVWQHDGSPLPGWPVNVGESLSDGPVAIGDLNGDGEAAVVVGTLDGQVYAYHPDGTLMDGWPADALEASPTYVSIGAVGGPYPRAVLAAAGSTLCFKDWRGERYPGSINRGFGGNEVHAPAAIGDIDGDGGHEVVVAASQSVIAFPMDLGVWDINRDLGATVYGGVALADFDLDGDVEIVATLGNGVVYLLDDDGSDFPGDWPVTVNDDMLNGAAIALCLGTSEPEIAVTGWDGHVSILWFDGNIGAGWPEEPAGMAIHSRPIMGRVDGSSSDVVVANYFNQGWAWSNVSALIPGWPKAINYRIDVSPAYGDLDLDGSAEIVFLNRNEVVVLDLNIAPSEAIRTWGMVGHDPERSGCADCALDVVAVEDAPTGVTRVSMAAPWPNPIAGQATFAYAVPIRARVELAIYDVRGRRVATVHRAEESAGQHVIGWNGRDDSGRAVASGQYVAALRVQGPGVDETVSRKVTVLR